MTEVAITEQLIRRADPKQLQAILVDAIEDGVTVFSVKPDGLSWTEWRDVRSGYWVPPFLADYLEWRKSWESPSGAESPRP